MSDKVKKEESGYKILETMILDDYQKKKMSDFQLQNLMTANLHLFFTDACDLMKFSEEVLSIVDSFGIFVDEYEKLCNDCDLSYLASRVAEEATTLITWYRREKVDSIDNDFVFIELNKAMSTISAFDDCDVTWCREYGFSPNSQIIMVYRECVLNMNMDIKPQDIETHYYCALACLVVMASNVDKLISGIKSGFTIKSTFWSDILLYDKEHV